MSDALDLYRRTLLDHHRRPRNRRALPSPPALRGEADNRLCGDRVTLYLDVDDDAQVREATFEGHGCAISVAAASLLAEALAGRRLADARALVQGVRRAVLEGAPADDLGDLGVLTCLAPHAARHRCATLVTEAFAAALDGSATRGSP